MNYWSYEEISESRVSFIVHISQENPSQIAKKMGVSERTFYRYLSKDFVGNKLPILMAAGQLGAIDKAWNDWRLTKGLLIHPSGISVHPSQLFSLDWYRNLTFSHLGRLIGSHPWGINRAAANEARPPANLSLVKSGSARWCDDSIEMVQRQPDSAPVG
jgi:hypothetical protein